MGAQQVGPRLAGETAFDTFYRDHRDRLIATVNAATRCGADAATDAVDEAFVRALARWSRVERMEAPAGWIFTVARNVVHKGRSRRSAESALAPTATGVGPRDHRTAGSSVTPEAQWELWSAVADLPERERTAVALRYLGDLTEPQVASVMGVAPGTVSATLHAARKRLAAQLGEPDPGADDGDPPDPPGATRSSSGTTDHGGLAR